MSVSSPLRFSNSAYDYMFTLPYLESVLNIIYARDSIVDTCNHMWQRIVNKIAAHYCEVNACFNLDDLFVEIAGCLGTNSEVNLGDCVPTTEAIAFMMLEDLSELWESYYRNFRIYIFHIYNQRTGQKKLRYLLHTYSYSASNFL